jgi:hypothetical protein
MAILSIMAGTLVPMLYKTWESNEIAVTRGRMLELKKAMVGDRALVQQGIRTHYGFAGDNGVLPPGIDDLLTAPAGWVNWNGPYLGGFDPDTYKSDAWGTDIEYTRHDPFLAVSGMSVIATLRSAGPDRTFGTGDDIDENSDLESQIFEDDVWPTATVQGNLSYTFTAGTSEITPAYWADILASYHDGAGTATTVTVCIPLAVGPVQVGVPKNVGQSFEENFGIELPVGRVKLRSRLFSDNACTAFLAETNEMATFVNDGLSKIPVNPPTLYYPIN